MSNLLVWLVSCRHSPFYITHHNVAKWGAPHFRHTTASHLLRADVDINTIRAWLGHVSINTTNIYAETDLETKARALAACTPTAGFTKKTKPWGQQPDLMEFLHNL